MKVLMNMWPRFLLSHIGDYYANTEVAAMKKQYPDMEFVMIRSPIAIAAANARVLILHAAHKTNLLKIKSPILQPLHNLQCASYLPEGYLRNENPDVIFAHSHMPYLDKKCLIPMVAVEYIASERHMRLNDSFHCLPLEIRAKQLGTRFAKVILTTTPTSKARFEQYIPETKGRIWQAPIYMPYLEPVNEDSVFNKFNEDRKLQILFVGGAAKRKGLPHLVEAMKLLEKSVLDVIQLIVISNFQDGHIFGVEKVAEVFSNVDAKSLNELMKKSHIFVFPTNCDTFGRVIVESMASGCAIITSNTDPQDWMMDYGRVGITVDPNSPFEIAGALTGLVRSRDKRMNYALVALKRFNELFYHRVVAGIYRNAFNVAIMAASV